MSFICHIHNYTEYNEEWNVFSAFNPSKCTHLEQWAADCAVPGEQSWTSCRSRDSNPQPWVTSGFKSNALSIRPTTAQHPSGHSHALSQITHTWPPSVNPPHLLSTNQAQYKTAQIPNTHCLVLKLLALHLSIHQHAGSLWMSSSHWLY